MKKPYKFPTPTNDLSKALQAAAANPLLRPDPIIIAICRNDLKLTIAYATNKVITLDELDEALRYLPRMFPPVIEKLAKHQLP